MALIRRDSGCKVGWEFYDNEEEARARSESALREGYEAAARGYDFGYTFPGTVDKTGDLWRVTTA